MAGLFCGLVRFVWEFSYTAPLCNEEDSRPVVIRVNYLHFSIILWIISTFITVFVSLLTKPSDDEKVFIFETK
jgi:hypothetical protein